MKDSYKSKRELIIELQEFRTNFTSLKVISDLDMDKLGKIEHNLAIANKELAFQDKGKVQRADQLAIANKELVCQVEEKAQRIEELVSDVENAEKSNRLKSSFLANMSHEIRTLMNGILGFTGLLKEPNLPGEEQQEYIRIIEKSGFRLLNIINDIVDISKIESGLLVVNFTKCSVSDQVDYIYDFFKPEMDSKKLQFIVNKSFHLKNPQINTDQEKLLAVLINLFKNAIKYTDAGSIEVGYEPKGKMIEFFVKDTGIGIPKERLEAIFERFIQADIENRHAYQGAGLGLSIAKAYVELLGGAIWVKSVEGKGSTFYFSIPMNQLVEETPIKIDDADVEMNYTKNLIVLIAEDDNISEMLLSMEVNVFSKQIIKVKTGIQAVEVCRNNPDIDLILMDIMMPEMSGYDATKLIRQFNKEVIIIAQTAFGFSEDREKAIRAGCNDYLSKPVDGMELQSMIRKYCRKNS